MSSLLDPLGFSSGGNEGGLFSGLDPAGLFSGSGVAGGDSILGSFGQTLADPLDLFGIRAGQTQDEINRILTGSAQENIALQEGQLAQIAGQTAPFRAAATDVALPQLSALAFGGNVDFQPSKLFGRQLEQGRTGILRGQAAGGAGVKSSRTFERLGDLVSGLAGEDVGRFEQGQQSLLNQGITATNQLGQSGSQLTGNVANIFSNLGQGLNAARQGQGLDRQTSFQGLSSGLSGLADFIASRPKE
jgi:hypothetical protein